VVFPAGSVASDWLVMNAVSNDPIQTPPGWTLNQSRYWLAWGSWQYSNVYTRQRGTDTNVTISLMYGGVVILAFQGVGGNGTIGSFALSTQTASTLDVGGITPQHANSLVLGVINDRDVSPPVNYADGYTNFVNYNMTYFGTNFTGKAFGNTTATGTQTWSQAASIEAVGMLMELRPIVAPTTTASFSPSTDAVGGVSSLTFNVSQANAYPLSNATFSVTLPANVSIASGQIGGTCVGTTTTPALTVGATSLSFSVPSLPSTGCTVVVQVSSSAIGTYNVASTGVTTDQTPVAGAAGTAATLTTTTTVLPPAISLGFSPEWIASGGTSTVTYSVSSPSGVALQNAVFSHTLNNLTVANTTIGGTCTGVTASPALSVGATSVSLNIPTLPSSGCTVTIGVSSTVLGYHANATSAVTANGVSGSGNPSQTDYLTVNQSNVGIFYVHADHLGTPRAITDPSDNTPVWRWRNDDPFGNNPPDENPSGIAGTFKYNLRLPGQYFDQETGTYYNYFRDYDPSTGRYVQSDPIGLAGGINTYAYVGGSPLHNFDPFGLSSLNARVSLLLAQGNLAEAIVVAQAAGLAIAPRLQQMQTSIQSLVNRYPLASNQCEKLANGVAEAFKAGGQIAPQVLRVEPTSTRWIRIGENVTYAPTNHVIVRVGDMVYDATTGAQGMAYSQYINVLNQINNGPTSYIIKPFTVTNK